MASNLFKRLKLEAIFWLARRLPVCRELTPWMSERLDKPLPLAREIKLRLHIMICDFCKRYQEQLYALREAVRTMDEPEAAAAPDQPRLSDDARERIKQAIRNSDR